MSSPNNADCFVASVCRSNKAQRVLWQHYKQNHRRLRGRRFASLPSVLVSPHHDFVLQFCFGFALVWMRTREKKIVYLLSSSAPSDLRALSNFLNSICSTLYFTCHDGSHYSSSKICALLTRWSLRPHPARAENRKRHAHYCSCRLHSLVSTRPHSPFHIIFKSIIRFWIHRGRDTIIILYYNFVVPSIMVATIRVKWKNAPKLLQHAYAIDVIGEAETGAMVQWMSRSSEEKKAKTHNFCDTFRNGLARRLPKWKRIQWNRMPDCERSR